MNDKNINIKYSFLKRPYPRVALHPHTIKASKKGHPWVTADRFSLKFPKNNTFLIGLDGASNEYCLLIHDPEHKNVKARIWSQKEPFITQVKNFENDLTERLIEAFEKRANLGVMNERENYYLVFGEGDFIPGLFLKKLGNTLIMQYYATFWNKMEEMLLSSLSRAIRKTFPEWKQVNLRVEKRNHEKKLISKVRPLPHLRNIKTDNSFVINEFGINYNVFVDSSYDNGIYTDMSAIRKQLFPVFDESKKVLNLFSYTGAYSLTALKHGSDEVVSVDLSGKYLNMLEDNIKLNEDLDISKHRKMTMSVEKALKKLIRDEETFDLLICDPPSASSDGRKTSQALKNYEKILPDMINITEKSGHIVVMLNTHNVTWNKFTNQIEKILKSDLVDRKVSILRRLKLKEDCPIIKGHQEGDYLKGILLKVIN